MSLKIKSRHLDSRCSLPGNPPTNGRLMLLKKSFMLISAVQHSQPTRRTVCWHYMFCDLNVTSAGGADRAGVKVNLSPKCNLGFLCECTRIKSLCKSITIL